MQQFRVIIRFLLGGLQLCGQEVGLSPKNTDFPSPRNLELTLLLPVLPS